jgi:hypothetical protein
MSLFESGSSPVWGSALVDVDVWVFGCRFGEEGLKEQQQGGNQYQSYQYYQEVSRGWNGIVEGNCMGGVVLATS